MKLMVMNKMSKKVISFANKYILRLENKSIVLKDAILFRRFYSKDDKIQPTPGIETPEQPFISPSGRPSPFANVETTINPNDRTQNSDNKSSNVEPISPSGPNVIKAFENIEKKPNGKEKQRKMGMRESDDQGAKNKTKTFLIYGLLTGGAVAYILIGGAPKLEEISKGDTEVGFISNMKRLYKRCSASIQSYKDPVFEKLLPDPYTGPEAKPYTLVIDLDKFLVCHIWDPIIGRWRVAKRPGADIFLFYMAHMYEVVVYSSLSQFEGDEILMKLDPMQFITFRLYRFATKYENGKYIKDLKKLNRDLEKVVVFGHDVSFSSHPENFIRVEPWNGDPNDKLLENAIDFFEALAYSNIPDVRKVVSSYQGMNVFERFDEMQRFNYESIRQSRIESNKRIWKRALAILFTPPEMNSVDTEVPWEEKKKQITILRHQEYVKEYERIKKEFDKQMESSKQYMASHKSSIFDLITKGVTPPPPELLTGAAASVQNSE